MSRIQPSRPRGIGLNRVAALVAALALLGSLVAATRAASESPPACKGGTHKEIEVGIVKAVGCFTEASKDGAAVYTGRWEDQAEGIDLNGFVLTGPKGGALQINTGNREVKTVALQPGPGNDEAQLNSRNWPVAGKVNPMGKPITIGFIAPETGSVLLEDLHLGSNTVANALAGLSPIGTVETPVKLEEDGKGSMDLTIALAGVFTLKGHPQSVTIALPTESEKGTILDGFELELEEIDTFKVVVINNFEAKYSASTKLISGSATLTFPFALGGKKGKENERGFGGGFTLENGALTEIKANASGLKLPIGTPPGGFVTGIGGGLRLKNNPGKNSYDLVLAANLDAVFGPEIPLPWGKVAPIEASAAMQAGHRGEEWFIELRGGVKVFRLPVGDVYLGLYTNAGVKFGAGLGIGFPSYRNNENDPFYIGARVDGWVSRGKFQFEGKGRVALFSLKLFDGRIMVNNRAAGACWTVIGFPGGAVYPYGGQVKDFGVGCGLDYYKEQMPSGARISATGPRTIHLGPAERILKVKGAGAAPRFKLRSPSGKVVRTPTDRDAVIRRNGLRHAFFVNEGTNTTHVIVPSSRGNWTLTPYQGSAPISSIKAGREAPKERVTAEVRGRGPVRTLTWDSLDRDNTRLLFLERLPNGHEVPIFQTDKPSGSREFRTVTGAHYGQRDLRVVVIHGYGSRQSGVVDDYRVGKPRRLGPPQRIAAWRDRHDVHVRWGGVEGARGYLVEVSLPHKGKRVTNFVREVSAKQRSLRIPQHPGGGTAVARVYALNRDEKLGEPARAEFLTGPATSSLREAARHAARTATRRGNGVRLRSACPSGGHCRILVTLRHGDRTVARARFQQTPDTFQSVVLKPRSASARAALRRGDLRVSIRADRGNADAIGSATVEP